MRYAARDAERLQHCKATGGGQAPGVNESYQLFSLSGSYRFGEKYTLRVGIDNLLNEDSADCGRQSASAPFPNPGTHLGGFAPALLLGTYDPLGRRGFVSFYDGLLTDAGSVRTLIVM